MSVTAVEGASGGVCANLDLELLPGMQLSTGSRHQQMSAGLPSKGSRLLQVPSEEDGARGWREGPMTEESSLLCPPRNQSNAELIARPPSALAQGGLQPGSWR